ncbi:MAG: dipicolinate synthase subunit DpsA [Ruminococcus sp.]
MRADSYKIAVIAGDRRQVYLARILTMRGYRVTVCGLCENLHDERIQTATVLAEALKGADAVAAPVPFLRAGRITGIYEVPDMNMETLLEKMPKAAKLFAGNIPAGIKEYAEKKKFMVYDLMLDEFAAAANAVSAAEGAAAEAIARSPVNLSRSRCIVLGYGRCGKALVRLLKAFACHVLVSEKDPMKAAEASTLADGIINEKEIADGVADADFIFNTVPEIILTAEYLRHVKKRAWILDLASPPGGVDYQAAESMFVNAVLLPGLPGRYAPESSAEIFADFIESRIKAL